MNNCVLMAKITSNPELRYIQDTQRPITEMRVEIEGLGPNSPPATIKVIGWGNMAEQIKENYLEGDEIIAIGRLSMRNFDHPEGYKEKRAELIVSQIHRLGGSPVPETSASSHQDNVVSLESFKPQKETRVTTSRVETEVVDEDTSYPPTNYPPANDQDLDDIPF